MRHIGKTLQARCFAGLTAMTLTFVAQAQTPGEQTSGQIPEDYYRAELVIIERKMAPEDVTEHMSVHPADLIPEQEEKLLVVTRDGERVTTLDQVSRNELHLASAAQRLENSGRFRVLAAVGWYQAFPPDHEGAPMQVALGDWLEHAGHRQVEGTITIDRQRYLHVDVNLNHWYQDNRQSAPLMGPLPDRQDTDLVMEEATNSDPAADTTTLAASPESAVQANESLRPVAELLTWLRETRRMRSEEVHYLDSPTLGVMVYFSPVEPNGE